MSKEFEDAWKPVLPAHTYKILRLDGRAFSSWTKKHCSEKPFDPAFSQAMNFTARDLCKEVQGAQFAYTQSDEISLLIADLDEKAQQWFGGDVVKTVSVSASIASNSFNFWMSDDGENDRAQFDARVFPLPDRLAVEKYFLERQGNAYTNAVSMLASSHFSHKQLHGKTTYDRVAMLAEKGVPIPVENAFGRMIKPIVALEHITWTHKKTGVEMTEEVRRQHWKVDVAQWFDWDVPAHLSVLIP